MTRQKYEKCIQSNENGSQLCNFSRQDFKYCIAKHRPMLRTKESEIINNCFGKHLRSSNLGNRHIDKGIYSSQLYRWFLNFNESNFFITRFEDFVTDTDRIYKSLIKYLGHSEQTFQFEHKLLTNNTRKRNLDAYMVRKLKCFYQPYNAELARLVPHLAPYNDTKSLDFCSNITF
jgi:hypothetical protein